jgi:hypothetical protein
VSVSCSGALSCSGTNPSTFTYTQGAVTVANGGTGLTTYTSAGRLIYSTGATTATTLASSTLGTILQTDANGNPSWVATSTLKVSLSDTTGNIKTYPAFTYATSTAWTGTTTIPLGTSFVAETWNAVQCFTDTGTLNVDFYHTSSHLDFLNASTTVGTFTFSTNATLTAAEKRYVDIGTAASSPTKISCTISKSLSPR